MQKIYKEAAAAIARNKETAQERRAHNRAVDDAKHAKKLVNAAVFVPRKASHKQGANLR